MFSTPSAAPMLLSVKPPLPNGIKSTPHDYNHLPPNPSRYSPPESPRTAPSFFDKPDHNMNNQHRGLPPPMGMTLPPPDRGLSAITPMGLPAPPSGWTGQDESMRNWLQAKAEEDRRKAEEEKTRQEGLRLDQRRIEQSMLRESLQGGVPPVMVPLIFAGMGGGALSTQTLEWAQHYMAQLSIQSQQQQHSQPQIHPPAPQHQPMSPEMGRGEHRMIPPNPYGGHQLQPALSSSALQSQLTSQPPPPSLGRPSLSGPPEPRNTLSRIQTGGQLPGSSSQQLHHLPPSQPPPPPPPPETQNPTPGLFFHHWTPSAANPKSNQPPTPSGKDTKASPFSQSQQSHLRSDYHNSPKKRKAAGGLPVTAPTSAPSENSPPFSSRSSRERDLSPGRNKGRRHSRQRSDASSTRESDGRVLARPSSRQQKQDELSGVPIDPNRQDTISSVSTASGDEAQTRFPTGQPETARSPYSAATEMREIAGAKRELEA